MMMMMVTMTIMMMMMMMMMMMLIITDEYDDDATADVEAKSVARRRSGVSGKKRVYIPVFVPEKQKKKSKSHIKTLAHKNLACIYL